MSPNLVRELPQGFAVVQVKQPAVAIVLEVVALDRIDTDGLPAYAPVQAAILGADVVRAA